MGPGHCTHRAGRRRRCVGSAPRSATSHRGGWPSKAIRAGYRHTIYEYATELPGQDDIVVARTPLAKFVVVRNPDIARHVLVSNQDNYAKNAEYDLLAVAFGRGLVTDLNDELWQRNRRLVQPIFAKRQVDAFAPQMTDASVAAARRWEANLAAGQPVDIAAEMNYVTLDIIARTMFGIELNGRLAEQMRTDFARLLTLFGYGFLLGAARPLRRIAEGSRHRGSRSTRCGAARGWWRPGLGAACGASNASSIS